MNIPDNLKYTETHEWVRMNGDSGAVGITGFAQQELGDVVFVEPPEVGASLSTGAAMGSVESVKAVSEISAPVSGVVAEVNKELEDHPELINEDPYGRGWIVVIKLSDASEPDALMDSAAYAAYVAESGKR